ncbi:MAG TPA: hypothetical protein VJI66_02300 [Candidatus Paceibacterota bacterium]
MKKDLIKNLSELKKISLNIPEKEVVKNKILKEIERSETSVITVIGNEIIN